MNIHETRKAWCSVKRNANAITSEYGLSIVKFLVLDVLRDKKLSISQIAKEMDTTLAFAVNTIKALRTDGWVDIEKDEDDARKTIVKLKDSRRVIEIAKKIDVPVEQLRIKD